MYGACLCYKLAQQILEKTLFAGSLLAVAVLAATHRRCSLHLPSERVWPLVYPSAGEVKPRTLRLVLQADDAAACTMPGADASAVLQGGLPGSRGSTCMMPRLSECRDVRWPSLFIHSHVERLRTQAAALRVSA